MVTRSRIQIPDHFSTSLTIVEYEILGDLLPFLIQSPADFYDTWQNYSRWQENESNNFGSNPTDIQMRINPGMWLRIPDQILALVEFALSECSSPVIT